MSQWSEGDVRAGLRALVPDLAVPVDRFHRVSALAGRRRRVRLTASVLAAAATAAVLAIGQPLALTSRPADPAVAPPTAGTPAALTASTWVLVSYEHDGRVTTVDDTDNLGETTLRIDRRGTFAARACNDKSGTVVVKATTMRFSDAFTMDGFCVGNAGPLELAFSRLFHRPVTWAAGEGRLTLTASDGSIFRFVAPWKHADSSPAVPLPVRGAVDDLANRVHTLVTEKHLSGLSTVRVEYPTRTVYLRWVGAVPVEITQLQRSAVGATLAIATGTYTEQQMDVAAKRVIEAFSDRTKQPFWVTRAGRTSDGSGIEVTIAPPGTYGTPALSQEQLTAVHRTIAEKAAPLDVVSLGFEEPATAAPGTPRAPSPYLQPTLR